MLNLDFLFVKVTKVWLHAHETYFLRLFYLSQGAFIDTNHPCGTALITASRFQQHEAVKFLLDQGASPSMRNTMLDTCLHIAVKNADVATVKIIMEVHKFFYLIIFSDCIEISVSFTDRVYNVPHAYQRCFWIFSLVFFWTDMVFTFSKKCGRDLLELKDKNENTALHLAATTGNLEV